jgi:hypothetical protein
MRLMMRLARDLGYTVLELSQRITIEELRLWAMLYESKAKSKKTLCVKHGGGRLRA